MPIENPLALMIRKLAIHTTLSPADRSALLALPSTIRRPGPAAYLVREGESPEQCAILLSGFAHRQKLTGEGTRQIVSIHLPGDILDLQHLFLDVADHSVQTLTHAVIATVPREALRRMVMENGSIARAILVSILVEASIFREWVLNIGRRDARARMAHMLCEFAARLDAIGVATGSGYDLPMTQEQIADALGLTPVHVNRTLRGLEAEGLIERHGRQVRFPEPVALREVADFNPRYLHLAPQAVQPAPTPEREPV